MRGPLTRRAQPDWLMLGAAAGLSAAGLLVCITAGGEAALEVPRWVLQLIWTVLGIGAGAGVILFDHRRLAKASPLFYIVVLVLLGIVLLIPVPGGAARRWLTLGPFHLQPSELAKLA
ncbi:FtsW/RodA/SpoVE family cell cycle protein, partial [bacterium]|nr:FtsW/RodA/SpoVE family cell cycle protein [bacterium]